MPRKWHILFSAARKVCKRAAAAPAALKGSNMACLVDTASAKAEEKLNGDVLLGQKSMNDQLSIAVAIVILMVI